MQQEEERVGYWTPPEDSPPVVPMRRLPSEGCTPESPPALDCPTAWRAPRERDETVPSFGVRDGGEVPSSYFVGPQHDIVLKSLCAQQQRVEEHVVKMMDYLETGLAQHIADKLTARKQRQTFGGGRHTLALRAEAEAGEAYEPFSSQFEESSPKPFGAAISNADGRRSTSDAQPVGSSQIFHNSLTSALAQSARAKSRMEEDEQNLAYAENGMGLTRRGSSDVLGVYEVTDFYHTTGICQRIARRDAFANCTLMVIAANAIYIGVDADRNHAASVETMHPAFLVSDNAFCMYFIVELSVRFLAFHTKKYCLQDSWFIFDAILVLMMIFETWVKPLLIGQSWFRQAPTGLIKLVRLLRLARMARFVRCFPELVAMIKGVKAACRAMGSALLMLVILIYVFAIMMLLSLKEAATRNDLIEERFGTLSRSMWTLFVEFTLLDGIANTTQVLYGMDQVVGLVIGSCFVVLSAMTVMNILIGVLCEVVTTVASIEKEDSEIRLVRNTVAVMLLKLDEDGSGEISRDEMESVFDDSAALQVLDDLKVDLLHLANHLDMHYEGRDDLAIQQIVDLILTFRGDRVPTMKDLLDENAFVTWKLLQTEGGPDGTASF